MVDSSEDEEEAPTVVKRNYKLPKKKRRLTVAPPCRQKKYKKSAAKKDSNNSDSWSGDSLPIAKASRRLPPTREPLQEISPTTASQHIARNISHNREPTEAKAIRHDESIPD
jgi:hypothetical protein